MTSLERPVVPDVGISTARSPGLTAAPRTSLAVPPPASGLLGVAPLGAAPLGVAPLGVAPLDVALRAGTAGAACAQSPASSPASSTPSGSSPAILAWATRAARPGSVI